MNEDSKNRDFVQFYRGYLDEIAELASQNSTAYKLFMLLCKHMDGTNALCVSRITLAELLNCTDKTISRAVKYLKENGWLCVLKSGTSNVYIINPDVAWTSYGNQKSYCRFQASVLLSSTENNEFLDNPKATVRFKTVDSQFIKNLQDKQKDFDAETGEIFEQQEA